MVVEEVDVGGRVVKPADDCPAKNIGSLTEAQVGVFLATLHVRAL